MKIYERLSRVYDLDWGNYAGQYVNLISQLFDEQGISRARILDLACGTGTLALELVKRSHAVFGIDISPQMIAIAKSKCSGFSHVSFEVQDMTQFCADGKFDLITCTFDSVNYLLNTDAVKAMFLRVASALFESGLFVFDSNTDRLYVNRHHGIHQRKLGGETFIQKLNYDSAKKEATTIFEFSDGEVELHRQRPYDLTELGPILAESGFSILRKYSGFDKKSYDSESERLICI
ncbi:MAG: class I SAM-dependent methyltransferase, partial [Candidatus Zixiibacteriota bacterium]